MSIQLTTSTVAPGCIQVGVHTHHTSKDWKVKTTWIPSTSEGFPLVTFEDECGNHVKIFLSARTVGQWVGAFQAAAKMCGDQEAIQDLRECAALNKEPHGPDAAGAKKLELELDRATRDGIEIPIPSTTTRELEEAAHAILD